MLCDGLRIVGEGAHADNGVGRIVVHVHVGRKIRVDPNSGHLFAHQRGDFLCDVHIVDRAERHVAGRHRSLRQTGNVAALLVGGDEMSSCGRSPPAAFAFCSASTNLVVPALVSVFCENRITPA